MFANSVDFTIMVLMLLDFMQINLIFFFFLNFCLQKEAHLFLLESGIILASAVLATSNCVYEIIGRLVMANKYAL